MKRSGIDHPKFRRLAVRLGIPAYSAIGIAEVLWHVMASSAAPVDRRSIERAIAWSSETDLCGALEYSGLLEQVGTGYVPTPFFRSVSRPVAINRRKKQLRRARIASASRNDLSEGDWISIVAAFGGRCAYCLEPVAQIQVEHMIPLSRGGSHTLLNVVPACAYCNTRKGTKTPLEFVASLPPLGGDA